MSVTIREKSTGEKIAHGETDADVLKYEGNWYFSPGSVEVGKLVVTERTYTCPYKGTCHWVDFAGPSGVPIKDVAWIYAAPKPGHEVIKDRYGFYAGNRGATRQD